VLKFRDAIGVSHNESLADSSLNRCGKNAINIIKITFFISLRGSSDA
jgi:hypothetical protein